MTFRGELSEDSRQAPHPSTTPEGPSRNCGWDVPRGVAGGSCRETASPLQPHGISHPGGERAEARRHLPDPPIEGGGVGGGEVEVAARRRATACAACLPVMALRGMPALPGSQWLIRTTQNLSARTHARHMHTEYYYYYYYYYHYYYYYYYYDYYDYDDD